MTNEELIKRGEAAARNASQWHQGSGTMADQAIGMAEQHAEAIAEGGDPEAHGEALKAWVEAAEADAKYLEKTEGRFETEDPEWNEEAGALFEKAEKLSEELL